MSESVQDSAATPVVCFPSLTGDNYGTWVRGMTKALSAKDKLGFVDGTIPEPTDAATYASWKRTDDLVSSWLRNSLIPEIKDSVLNAPSAAAIWKDLKERYQSSTMKLFQLKQLINSLKQEDLSVDTYYTRLRSLWDEVDSIHPVENCKCDACEIILEHLHEGRAMEFLRGLNDRYSTLRNQILQQEPHLSEEKIYNIVRREEEVQQDLNAVPTPAGSLQTTF